MKKALPYTVCVADGSTHRSPVSSGVTARLPRHDAGRHGCFLAVAALQGAQVAGTRCTERHSDALSIPSDLAWSREKATPLAAPRQWSEGRGHGSEVCLHLYAVSGTDGHDAAAPAYMQVTTIPIAFTPSSHADGAGPAIHDCLPASNSAVPIVEKIVWAGPCVIAALSRQGTLVIAPTGLSVQLETAEGAASRSSSSSTDNDDGVSEVAGMHQRPGLRSLKPHQAQGQRAIACFPRTLDAAGALLVSDQAAVSVVLTAGLSSVHATSVSTSPRGKVTATSSSAWTSIGPFHSVAALPAPPLVGTADQAPAIVFAGCARTSSVTIFRSEYRGGALTPPTVLRQLLMGVDASFLGVSACTLPDQSAPSASGTSPRCVFAALGVSTAPVPSVSDAKRAATRSDESLSVLTLRGAGGHRLSVEDYFDAESTGSSERSPLNEVFELLQRRVGQKAEAARQPPLEALVSSFTVAPPRLFVEGGDAESNAVFLLTATLGDSCVSRCIPMRSYPSSLAALRNVGPAPQLSPSLYSVAASGIGTGEAVLLDVVLRAAEVAAVLEVTLPLGNEEASARPKAVYRPSSAGSGKRRLLAGVEYFYKGADAFLTTLEGTVREEKEGERGEGGTQPGGPPSGSHPSAEATAVVSELQLCCLPVRDYLYHEHGGSDPQGEACVMENLVRSVVKEELDSMLAAVMKRMSSLEKKIDLLLGQVQAK